MVQPYTTLRIAKDLCICNVRIYGELSSASIPILAIHPIGVGLSSHFWDRFLARWFSLGQTYPLILPDLWGCGQSSQPFKQLTPSLWAEPLLELLADHISRPVVLMVQGAALPVALEVTKQTPELVAGLIMIGPPGWKVMGQDANPILSSMLWTLLFRGPLGSAFYLWARRRAFLFSFSKRELFAEAEDIDPEWLDTLESGARPMRNRWAVFSFLSGFWRRNYHPQLQSISIPVLALFGERASGISRVARADAADQRALIYQTMIPGARSICIPGRNVLPYESTDSCVEAVSAWLHELQL